MEALLAAASSPDPQVRYRVIWALGKIGDGRAFATICALTEDANEAVRYDAPLALGGLTDPRAAAFLEALVRRVTYEDNRLDPALSALSKLGERGIDWTRFIACA